MKMLLEVENLSVNFRVFDGLARVLDGISFYVDSEESVALIGETGCGKSVTMKSILRILPMPPSEIVSGKILFKGRNLLELTENEIGKLRGKEISVIPQASLNSLNPLFTVGDQLTDLIITQGDYSTGIVSYYLKRRKRKLADVEEMALKILKEVALPEPERILRAYPFELSGGEKQRVVIALALLGNPSLLIADEPGTALDVTTSNVILDLLMRKIKESNVSVIYITHNLAVAKYLARRIYVMYAGTIVESGDTKTIFENPEHPYTQGLIRSVPRLVGRSIKGIEGTIPNYYDPPKGCRFYPRCEYSTEKCSKIRPILLGIGGNHSVACHKFS